MERRFPVCADLSRSKKVSLIFVIKKHGIGMEIDT